MTIPEVLLSATLLLLISGILFNMLIPLMGRSVKLDQKQDNLQRGVVLRHFMNTRLKNAMVLAVDATHLEFYANDHATTPYGPLNRLGNDEMLAFDETRRLEIVTEARTEGTWVVEREVGTGAGNRGIWFLGQGGTWTLTYAKPLLTVAVTGTTGHFDGGTWTKSFDLVLPNAGVGP